MLKIVRRVLLLPFSNAGEISKNRTNTELGLDQLNTNEFRGPEDQRVQYVEFRGESGKAAGWSWSKRSGAVGHCARENARRNEAEQPAAIFVGYSVISSIQRTVPVFDPLDALFAFRLPMPHCLADGIRGASFDGCKCNARFVRSRSFVETEPAGTAFN